MTSQTFSSTELQTTPLPPTTPTLNFSPVGNVSSSTATILDSNASLAYGSATAATIDMVRISLAQVGGTLGILNGTTYSLNGTEAGGINYAYDATTRILTLDGDGTTTEAQYSAALKKVAFNGAGVTIANQSISANIGRPVYYAQNGHYYEFVSNTQATWTGSETAAKARTLFGLTGYLATITSQEENDFITRSFTSKGWIGGRADHDSAAKTRTWKWVSGPEAGTTFRTENIGTAGSITGVTQAGYNNWATGEPNNFGTGANTAANTNNEPYAHLLTSGKWNDLADNATATQVPAFKPDGYWVEYSTTSGTGDDGLGSTRKTGSFTIGTAGVARNAQEIDLVFYEQSTGQVYFAFPGQFGNITTVGPTEITGDAPKLTLNGTTPVALKADSSWRLVTADVDVDRDGKKDIIIQNTGDGSVAFWFGATRTGTSRDYAATRYAFLTSGGQVVTGIPEWRVEFASQRLGESNSSNSNGSLGLFWRSTADGRYGVGQLGVSVNANAPGGMTVEHIVPKFLLSAEKEWTAIGDGEFDATVATREILWRNSATGEVSILSYNAARSGVATGKYITQNNRNYTISNDWVVRAIANFDGVGNDEILFQNGSTIGLWKMEANEYIDTATKVLTVAGGDRIKDVADMDNDNKIDIIAQNDLNATVGYYTLDGSFNYKTSAPGTRSANYTVQGGAYRPGRGEGGVNWELVNVAQYEALA